MTAGLGAPPGEHHFYIEFQTTAPGVRLSEALKRQYPERMTIVLQHQFTDLAVHPDHFEVTLHFKGLPDRLSIPFDAVTQFADPSVNFALQFPTDGQSLAPPSAEIENLATHRDEDDDGPDDGGGGTSAEVVSIDRFRKK
jgi:hypothetical protein